MGSPEDSAFPLGKVGRSSSPVITEDVLVIYCCITNCPKYIILGNIRHLSSQFLWARNSGTFWVGFSLRVSPEAAWRCWLWFLASEDVDGPRESTSEEACSWDGHTGCFSGETSVSLHGPHQRSA